MNLQSYGELGLNHFSATKQGEDADCIVQDPKDGEADHEQRDIDVSEQVGFGEGASEDAGFSTPSRRRGSLKKDLSTSGK